MVKRVLHSIRLDKIAAVDKPCQAHATADIMKRAPVVDDSPQAVAKVTFQEALDGQLVSQRVSQAFYGCFDNLWTRNDAFRTALTDEIAAGGDGSKASADWLASVTQLAEDAVTAAKENGGKPTDDELAGAMDKAVTKYLSKQQEKPMFRYTTKAALQAAIAKFAPTTSTVQEVIDIQDSAKQLNEEAMLPVEGALAKVAPPSNTDDIVKLQEEIAILKLTPAESDHVKGMTDAEKKKFLALSAEDRKADMAKRDDSDPVVYKMADGTEVRKSAGAFAVTMAKNFDAQAATIKSLTEQTTTDSIAKRAGEFKHLPHPESIVKAHDALPEADRAGYLESMRAANKAAAGMFKRIGSEGGDEGGDSPQARMDAVVKRIVETDKIDVPSATIKAQTDPEFRKAYAEANARPGQMTDSE